MRIRNPDLKYVRLCEKLEAQGLIHELHRVGNTDRLVLKVTNEKGKTLAQAEFNPTKPNVCAKKVAEKLLEFDL